MNNIISKIFGNTKNVKSSSNNNDIETRYNNLSMQIMDNEIKIEQMLSLLKHEYSFYPAPPKQLQIRVVGTYVKDFFNSGYDICDDMNKVLNTDEKTLSSFSNVLDFGCGCGRVIRAFKNLYPDCHLYGTDIDKESIEWLQSNWTNVANLNANPSSPPTIYNNNQFEFIYSISVFTHLPEDMQFLWLQELRRITKPGGYLILTTHGEDHYRNFSSDIVKIMDEKGFYYAQPGFNYGQSIGLPDFYQNAYHSHAYIVKEWSKYFRIIHIEKLGISHHQDAVLLQKIS